MQRHSNSSLWLGSSTSDTELPSEVAVSELEATGVGVQSIQLTVAGTCVLSFGPGFVSMSPATRRRNTIVDLGRREENSERRL